MKQSFAVVLFIAACLFSGCSAKKVNFSRLGSDSTPQQVQEQLKEPMLIL